MIPQQAPLALNKLKCKKKLIWDFFFRYSIFRKITDLFTFMSECAAASVLSPTDDGNFKGTDRLSRPTVKISRR